MAEKYDVMSRDLRQTSPIREDGTVRASWGPIVGGSRLTVRTYILQWF